VPKIQFKGIYVDHTISGDVSLMFVMQREGIAILLKKLSRYPQDTIFHLNTWTFGYEVGQFEMLWSVF
jgi:hypothetical protein